MTGDQSVLLTVERDGPTPAGAASVAVVALVIPPGEADALLKASSRRLGGMVSCWRESIAEAWYLLTSRGWARLACLPIRKFPSQEPCGRAARRAATRPADRL
jgi:hypothetical protein